MQFLQLSLVAMLAALTTAMDASEAEVSTVNSTGNEETESSSQTESPDLSWFVPGCRYYCIWKRRPYCCDDGTQESPVDHEPHKSLFCPPMEQQICKEDGVYMSYVPGTEYTPIQADTPLGYTGVTLLAKGPPKKLPVCASDGYCLESQRCCPSQCAQRHICLLGLDTKEEDPLEGYE
ncbi:uncharacterized protein [Panulirus ornatus]|uniref:uncharacterized protein n=1 Tax=Panulirus ornatus TaxID=150431 RepID=UPI003A83FAED